MKKYKNIIKFRAYDKVNYRYLYFEEGFYWNDKYFIWALDGVADVPCRENIIMEQFTNLYDCNNKGKGTVPGVELYEGDIISIVDNMGEDIEVVIEKLHGNLIIRDIKNKQFYKLLWEPSEYCPHYKNGKYFVEANKVGTIHDKEMKKHGK
jgi:hypothetical protein